MVLKKLLCILFAHNLGIYLNTSVEEFVVTALLPDHALVHIGRIQNILRLHSQLIPDEIL